MKRIVATLTCLFLGLAFNTFAAIPSGDNQAPLASGSAKARLIVLTDIGNEPDDQMSLVRLLLYANEIDVEALVATTSTWLRTQTNPQTMHAIVADYGVVRPNLERHASGWPSASDLDSRISVGQPSYGMAAVGSDKMSAGAQAIIDAADRDDPRPLWIGVWGGANTLAQALWHVRETRSADATHAFVSKLRVYAISDQDDAGAWIRKAFPDLFYIVTPSSQDSGDYAFATWTGISGDVYYRNGDGADGTTVTNAWLEKNIRNKGPLSSHYLDFAFIMEGDTPSYLGLIDNGLASTTSPSWGGWGGRYILRQPFGETRPIWTQGGDEFSRITSRDTVVGRDGRTRISDQATIWRWRTAFQNDFAARMDWTILPYARANHNPIVMVNGAAGTAPIYLSAKRGAPLRLDASLSSDPDKQHLTFHWFYYAEAGFDGSAQSVPVRIAGADKAVATVTPDVACWKDWMDTQKSCDGGTAHIILEVTDSGSPNLTSYRRVILNITR